MEIRVDGVQDMRELARQCRRIGNAGLGRQMRAGLRTAIAPFKAAVKREALAAMPSGYGPTLNRALRFSARTTGDAFSAYVSVRTSAKGKRRPRHIDDLDVGTLRHPVFGRTRTLRDGSIQRSPWAVQSVRAGFWSRPAVTAGETAARELGRVLDEVADELARG